MRRISRAQVTGLGAVLPVFLTRSGWIHNVTAHPLSLGDYVLASLLGPRQHDTRSGWKLM